MKKNIYVVMGTCGEHSNREEWPVIAYFDEAKAQEHVVNADRRAKEFYATHARNYYSIERGDNEFDIDMQVDFTGTSYFILTVPVGDMLL